MSVQQISPADFLTHRSVAGAGPGRVLLDVREAYELEISAAPVAVVHIPLGQLQDRVSELDPQAETVVLCRSGARSMQAAQFLVGRGFRSVYNLAGGILAWSRDVDPRIPTY